MFSMNGSCNCMIENKPRKVSKYLDDRYSMVELQKEWITIPNKYEILREALKVVKSCKIRDKVQKTCLFM